jgi:hypothetical protein
MPKDIVILIHGMGSHKPGEITKQFADSINQNLNLIKGNKTADIKKKLDIKVINYDKFVDEMRTKMADNASPIKDRLGQINQIIGLNWGPQLVLKLASFESKFKNNKFFYTHLLDVIFYVSFLGAKVRVDVAKELTKIIHDDKNDVNIHIVAHSLGCGVIHDTLALLYRGDFITNDDIADLDFQVHRLKSTWMISNVSILIYKMNDISNPYKSSVNPSDNGCMDYYRNVAHSLDPFTMLEKFSPPDDGSWIPRDYYKFTYKNIETSAVTDLNTHDFSEYIRNPNVALPMIRQFLQIIPEKADRDKIFDNFRKDTIPGAYEELKDAFEDIETSNVSSLKNFMKTAKDFSEVVEDLKTQLGE